MKNFITIAALLTLFAGVAQAAPIPKDADAVGLDMKLEINGKVVSQPYDLLLLGETGKSTQQVDEHTSYAISATPTLADDGNVMISLEIEKIVDGQTTVISDPKIKTMNNQMASIEMRDDKKQTSVKMTVTPTL